MDVGGDLLVEHLRALAAEQQPFVADGGATHAQSLAASREPLLILERQALVVDHGLPVTPALVVAAEAAVIAVPGGDRALVETVDQLIADRPPSRRGVHGLVEPAELTNGKRVESDAGPRRPDPVRERREHLVLPLAVLLLLET